jgi:hypothetical protein
MLQKEFGLDNLRRGHTNVICCEMQFQAVAGTRAVPCQHSSVVAAEKNSQDTKISGCLLTVLRYLVKY